MLHFTPMPSEVVALLNNWDVADVSSPAPKAGHCPRCQNELYCESLYVGGKGYTPYYLCASGECEYMRRA